MIFFKKLLDISGIKYFQSLKPIHTKDKSNMELKQDEIKFSVQRIANLISNCFTSREAALQFVLEELDMSQNGNATEKVFVSNSGVEYDLYNNSTANLNQQNKAILLEVDNACMQLHCKLNMLNKSKPFKTELRLSAIDKIMKKYHIGKYSVKGVS